MKGVSKVIVELLTDIRDSLEECYSVLAQDLEERKKIRVELDEIREEIRVLKIDKNL